MAKRTGFGTVKGVLDDAFDARHVISLRFGVPSRISSIAVSYTQESAAVPYTSFDAGAVFLIKNEVSNNPLFYPDPYAANQWRSGAGAVQGPSLDNAMFEARWGATATGDKSRFFYFGDEGLYLEKDIEYSVIMPIAGANGAAVGSFPTVFGVLSVQGYLLHGKDPVGEMR